MKLLPELSGFRQSGEKIEEGGVFVCAKCQAKRTIRPGKHLPKCSRCKEHGYWYRVVQGEKRMDKWVESRIEELTEQRREELEEYFDDQWAGDDGEDAEERLSVEYSEYIIPEAIERLMYESGWDEECINAFLEVNAEYPIWDIANRWDEIEKKYPRYIEDARNFFQPYIDDYEQSMEAEKASYISESVEAELEEESEGIRAQAEAEFEEL